MTKNQKIKIIGIGGGGQQVVDYLYLNNKCENIEFIVMNSDEQFLNSAKTKNKILISQEITLYDKVITMFPKIILKIVNFKCLIYKICKLINSNNSLGCGGNPEFGKEYALRHIDKIREIVGNPDVVFLIASFGGGCGTGATPVIAEMLNEVGIKTIAIVGKPFRWEGEMRQKRTIEGIEKLKQYVEKYIIVDYQSLLKTFPPNTTLNASWNYVNEKVAEEFYKAINSSY